MKSQKGEMNLKVIVEIAPNLIDDEIIIKVREHNESTQLIQQIMALANQKTETLLAYKRDTEYFLDIKNILFFESDNNSLQVHTKDDTFISKYKLYQLEEVLPSNFIRISKSTILNIQWVNSIERNITSSSLVSLKDTYKTVYVSRSYYKDLKVKMMERRTI